MSLDITFQNLQGTCVYCERPESHENVADFNITHNLGKMAREAGLYKCLWEIPNGTVAATLTAPLSEGLGILKRNPGYYTKFDAPNGWGVYGDLVEFVEEVLQATKDFPKAHVYVSR